MLKNLKFAFYFIKNQNNIVYKKLVFKQLSRFLALLICIAMVNACKEETSEIMTISRDNLSIEEGKEVEIIYSDSAQVKVKVTAPLMFYYTDLSNPRQEFPKGVRTFFYDPFQIQQGVLTGKYAIRDERNKKVIIRDSVVWESITDGKLETSELIWDETTNIIRSSKMTKITRQNETIWGFNFETNDKLTQWKLLSPKGNLKVDELQQQFK
jgi:LPS export ABC transporter protein LptC